MRLIYVNLVSWTIRTTSQFISLFFFKSFFNFFRDPSEPLISFFCVGCISYEPLHFSVRQEVVTEMERRLGRGVGWGGGGVFRRSDRGRQNKRGRQRGANARTWSRGMREWVRSSTWEEGMDLRVGWGGEEEKRRDDLEIGGGVWLQPWMPHTTTIIPATRCTN